MRLHKNCEWCGEDFVAYAFKTRFCGPRCRQRSIDIRGGKWVPKLISPPVFDYITRAAV